MYFATHLVKSCLRKAPIDLTTLSFWHEPATGIGLHFTSKRQENGRSNLYAYISYGAANPTPARRATRVSVYGCRDGITCPCADAGWPLCCLSRIKRYVKRAMK